MSRQGRDQRNGYGVLAVALLLCYAFSRVHEQSQRVRGVDPILVVVRDAALVPAQKATASVSHWWSMHVSAALAGPRLATQNKQLRDQVFTLMTQNKLLLTEQAENERLRKLLDFQKASVRPVLSAEVLALKPSNDDDTLTLSRGYGDKIRQHTVVVAANGGLIGQVVTTSLHSSDVLMLTDGQSSIGAQVVGHGPHAPVGLCQGDRSNLLKLTYLQTDADVRPGDSVTTAGLGDTFPKDIPIGTIISVKVDQARSMKVAYVRPLADFDHLEEAFLLR